uniref:(northern house mosquito) hypothetical protein n=1 Tax=Culex pipiens TaxID=7175 RepID=A0A8D8FPK0_CULPI
MPNSIPNFPGSSPQNQNNRKDFFTPLLFTLFSSQGLLNSGNKLPHDDRDEISLNTLQHYFLSDELLLLRLATGATTTINTFEHFEGVVVVVAAKSIVHGRI